LNSKGNTAERIQAYIEEIGWPFHSISYAASGEIQEFLVVCDAGGEPVGLTIVWNDSYVEVVAKEVVQIRRAVRVPVFEYLMKLHWESRSPKFAWDDSDGEIRATWALPIGDGFPTRVQFHQVCTSVAEVVVRHRGELDELGKSSGPSLSGSVEERISAAADLAALGRDLVELARHKLPPAYVREDLVKRLAFSLGGPGQQVLLVGEPGTGKNALVDALAAWVAANDPRVEQAGLASHRLYECTPESFQISCIYAHELENKVKLVTENCTRENAVLFLDKAHVAVATGQVAEKPNRTIANLLLPYLAKNEIRVIGVTTPDGHKYIAKLNPSFAHCFHIFEVPEPSREESARIVASRMASLAAGKLAPHHYVFEPGLENRIVELSERFLRARRNPGAALQLLNEAMTRGLAEDSPRTITVSDIEMTLANMAGLRSKVVRSMAKLSTREVQHALGGHVIGQESAVRAAADVVIAYKTELNRPQRPVSTLLFVGPTGVGKTRLAQSLAEYLFGSEDALLRYDMSEYADPLGYTKLCGRRSYEEQPGRLVMDLLTRPFSVILFDEVEKAHETVFNMLLQVLGEGRLTDEMGRTASFLNSIIIMTSNVGSELYGRGSVGFGDSPRRIVSERDVQRQLESVFKPEFLNRIGRVVCFQPLSQDTIREIARRELEALGRRAGLDQRGAELRYTNGLIAELMRRGYDPKYGARAMQRSVEDLVTPAVAQLIAEQPELEHVKLTVGWTGESVEVKVEGRTR